MRNTLQIFLAVISLMPSSTAIAVEYPYKKVNEFKLLDSFKSIEAFEWIYEKYTKDCLDHTYGGSGGIPCLIGYDMWDRELNISYVKLMKIIEPKDRDLLKQSQLAWVKERDKSLEFNSLLLDKMYTDSGTMYVLMRAGDAGDMATPVVKQRALLLKKWLKFATEIKGHKRGAGK